MADTFMSSTIQFAYCIIKRNMIILKNYDVTITITIEWIMLTIVVGGNVSKTIETASELLKCLISVCDVTGGFSRECGE